MYIVYHLVLERIKLIMKKGKLVAFITAFSLASSMSTAFFTANAADDEVTPAVIENGVQLVYNEESSTKTTRVVDAYYAGLDDLAGATIWLSFPADTVTSTSFVLDTAYKPMMQQPTDNSATGGFNYFFALGGEGVSHPERKIGTYTFNVPEGTGEFTVTVSKLEMSNTNLESIKDAASAGDDDSVTIADESWVTIPAYGAQASPTATASPTPFVGTEKDFTDVAEPETTVTEGDKTGTLSFVTVTVKTEDGNDAVYGKDFVAKYNDVELTEPQYQRLIRQEHFHL